jgi:myo-inositol 2-dehydrogenase/D-chiro-inositol 1-dehydrogenase
MIKLGIVGLGRIGKVHLSNLLNFFPQVTVESVCSGGKDSLSFAKKLGVPNLFTDYGAMLSHGNLDAVVIASPTSWHKEHILTTLELGLPIFCEKPIDLEIETVRKLVSKIEQKGIPFMMGFNRRFDPNNLKIKQYITDKTLGDLQTLHITSRDPGAPPLDYIKTSGGLFLDMAIHDFDLARFFVQSEVTHVFSQGAVFGNPKIQKLNDIDTATTLLRFKNGCFTTIENSRNSTYGYDQRLEAFGSLGRCGYDNIREDSTYLANSKGHHQEKPLHFFIERYQSSYLNIMKAFIKLLETRKQSTVNSNDGLQSLIIGLAAKKSIMENRQVALTEIL